jgi:hypothetical protein
MPRNLRQQTKRTFGLAITACMCIWTSVAQAAEQQLSGDATLVCGHAATRAEREWQIPSSLLAAIGTVESGRHMAGVQLPIIWPWTINAAGRGFYEANKAAAVDMVRMLQRNGVKPIDVGCFQVDLFYHPSIFPSLDAAFDPETNARAAARILVLGRLGGTEWDGAIAAYHSASILIGAAYLQKVLAIWPVIKAHPAWGETQPADVFAVLLSRQAQQVRVVTPNDPVVIQSTDLPRVVSGGRPHSADRVSATVQWLRQPVEPLPSIVRPDDPKPLISPPADK